jgi:hypothetical protein
MYDNNGEDYGNRHYKHGHFTQFISLFMKSNTEMANHHQNWYDIRLTFQLNTHDIHHKMWALTTCVLCHTRLSCRTILSYSTHNRNIHDHHYICDDVRLNDNWMPSYTQECDYYPLCMVWCLIRSLFWLNTMHVTAVWLLPSKYELMMVVPTECLITYTTGVLLLPTQYVLMCD